MDNQDIESILFDENYILRNKILNEIRQTYHPPELAMIVGAIMIHQRWTVHEVEHAHEHDLFNRFCAELDERCDADDTVKVSLHNLFMRWGEYSVRLRTQEEIFY